MMALHDVVFNFPLANIKESVYAFILPAATLILKEKKNCNAVKHCRMDASVV